MSTPRGILLSSLLLAVCGSLALQAEKPACSTGAVPTSSGPVCGLTSTVAIVGAGRFTASAYLGIPYAVPPVGSRRWQYATLFAGGSPLQATAYGSACPQSTVVAKEPAASSSRCQDGKTLGAGESEDCLYLNVWVPGGTAASSRLPVMVFIHGGNFDQGSSTGGTVASSSPSRGNLYDGTYLAAAGRVIVVTLNYRLGALGFLPHDGHYNFGFADQLLALRWVQTNIAGFGGDPQRVTLFGQSAGAKSVGLHALASPRSGPASAAGLFQAAILESDALGLAYKTTAQAQALSEEFCRRGSSPCTSSTTACDLVEAQNGFLQAQPLSFGSISNFTWVPTVDHVYITGQPMASAASLSVPLILGTNRDEGATFVYQAEARAPQPDGHRLGPAAYATILDQQFGVASSKRIRSAERYRCDDAHGDCSPQLVHVVTDFAFTCANRRLAILASGGDHPQPLYLYQFDQLSSFNLWEIDKPLVPMCEGPRPFVPQCQGSVCHTDEIPYVFNSVWQFPHCISFTQPEEALSRTIGGYWTSFAQSRSPGRSWPLFGRKRTSLLLRASAAAADDPLDATANCSALWDDIGYEKPVPLAERALH